MTVNEFTKAWPTLKKQVKTFRLPWLENFAALDRDPFTVLISCILSLRTQDKTTGAASERLFKLVSTPEALARLSIKAIEKAIYPVGFYRVKARTIKAISRDLIKWSPLRQEPEAPSNNATSRNCLLAPTRHFVPGASKRFPPRRTPGDAKARDKHASPVPDTLEGLLALKGVGRKTANLVLTRGFDKYGICVDTHVHRVTNRWGLVTTKRPDETELALREILPKRFWKELNGVLVAFGQNICKPLSPFCSQCGIIDFCVARNVRRKR